ncbi:hypothetical protein SCP_1000920 [Sparassis crispa]|uniref:Methyltransferase domain-containing protein n=1 Tax=Sparassis crispa TaxID=139825 RepID=A0A401GXE2_9APHY|nr:hypothetical protein SCP_1000920 [Sparassis crispa]GBE86850.1 hypothetical protein SCP_1000920 [Sparassis crispa]
MSVDDPMVHAHDNPNSGDDSGDGPDLSQEDARSDTSSEITELRTEEFPDYFQERGNRLFHSHGRSPYPLPVDAHEQARYDEQHVLLHRLIGEHFVGPVEEVLQALPGEERHVVDLGTGTGKWVMEMAQRFPHVRFDGIDIVPIATRYPGPRVQFEMQDLGERFRYQDGTIDFVHGRSISMAVENYPRLLQEVARVLRPGGLFVACEWGRMPVNRMNPAIPAPGLCNFFDAVLRALQMRGGVHPTGPQIPGWIRQSGKFDRLHVQQFDVPIGEWTSDPVFREVGRKFADTLKTYTESVRMLLIDYGISEVNIQVLIDGALRELDTVPGMIFTYHTVHARRTRRM